MACREPQLTAIFVHSLIGDLVQEAVKQPEKLNTESTTCQRLFDILGFRACQDEDDDGEEKLIGLGDNDEDDRNKVRISYSACTISNISNAKGKHQCNWHSWLVDVLAEESTDDEEELYSKVNKFQHLQSTAVQTEQPRLRLLRLPANHNLPGPAAPCELTRQIIFIDALSMPLPNNLSRAPLADRFCYMLTDFASALYCSLAIMCCCTPNMFR